MKPTDYSEVKNRKPEDIGEIVLITGKRGSGKTALGFYLLEVSEKEKFTYGLSASKYHLLPDEIHPLMDIARPPEDATIFIDEAALLFSSREYMKNANREIAKLITQARHKDQNIIFASHTLRKLDVGIVIDTDAIFFKEPSFLHSRFERSEILESIREARASFDLIRPEDRVRYAYLVSHDQEEMMATPLPSFWSEELSKTSKVMSRTSRLMRDISEISCIKCDSYTWRIEGEVAVCKVCGRKYEIKEDGKYGTFISYIS